MPPPVLKRKPVAIDDVAIDFTAVRTGPSALGGATDPKAAHATVLSELTQQAAVASAAAPPLQEMSDVRAFDPRLQSVAQQQVNPGRRRKAVFGRRAISPSSTSAAPPATTASMGDAESAHAAAEFLATTQVQLQSRQSLLDRKQQYGAALRQFVQQQRCSRSTSTPATPPVEVAPLCPSLHEEFFADGVPDIEPWDRWTFPMRRYGTVQQLSVAPAASQSAIHAAKLDIVSHPVLADTYYTRHYQYAHLDHPVVPKTYKTKEELRAERRERLKEKQLKAQQEKAKASTTAGNAGGGVTVASAAAPLDGRDTGLLHDRLSNRNLTLSLLSTSILNPLAADTKVRQQYELRFLEHQRRNHDRHVAALPNQIEKRAREVRRHATEQPLLRAYRIYPIYNAAHLGKLRNFANDQQLRGFILWVCECDAVVVLAGGEVAARHLNRWILQKMEWESDETTATLLFTVPLKDPATFSFHLRRHSAPTRWAAATRTESGRRAVDGAEHRKDAEDDGDGDGAAAQPVYMNFVSSVEEGAAFLQRLPAPTGPWANLSAVWRTAFLLDGLGPSTM